MIAPSRHPPREVEDFTVDEDGLLCALTIAPSTYSRNRFFRLFEQPRMRRAQRRARLLRGILQRLARGHGTATWSEHEGGRTELSVVIPALAFRQRALLTPIERDLVTYLLARLTEGHGLDPRQVAESRARVEHALGALGGIAFEARDSLTRP